MKKDIFIENPTSASWISSSNLQKKEDNLQTEEAPFDQNNSPDTKVVFAINRDTGEFRLLNYYFILDFQTNTVFLMENDTLIPVCTGHRDKNNWYFKGMGIIRAHTDPFVAAFKVLYYVLNY